MVWKSQSPRTKNKFEIVRGASTGEKKKFFGGLGTLEPPSKSHVFESTTKLNFFSFLGNQKTCNIEGGLQLNKPAVQAAGADPSR